MAKQRNFLSDVRYHETLCAFCGSAPALFLCDFAIGFGIAGWTSTNMVQAAKVGRLEDFDSERGLPYTDFDQEPFTCDAPLCEKCRTYVGNFFACGKEGFAESHDLCPFHKDKRERLRCINASEAEKARIRAWKFMVTTKVKVFAGGQA